MHVLIIEATLTGHHSGYLERVAAAYLDAGHSVTVTVLKRDTSHAVIARLRSRFRAAFNLSTLEDGKYDAALRSRAGDVGRELAVRRLFGSIYRNVHRIKPVDYVFLPYLDYCLYALGLLGSPFGSSQWGGLCMRPSFHYQHFDVIAPKPKLARVKQALFFRLLRAKFLRSIYTIDELLYRFISARHEQADRLHYAPDPVDLKGDYSAESARRELNIPYQAVVILVYGAIDDRKGLDSLASALANPALPTTLHILVVGKLSQSANALMRSSQFTALVNQGRCHVIAGFVNDTVQQMVFASSDIVWLGYRKHYSMSGVLVLAVAAGKPVLATNEGLIGWYTRRGKLGWTVEVTNPNSIVRAISEFVSTETEKRHVDSKLVANHSWEKFLSIVVTKQP